MLAVEKTERGTTDSEVYKEEAVQIPSAPPKMHGQAKCRELCATVTSH